MKVIQRFVVFVFCLLVFNPVFARDETYHLTVGVSVEPVTSDTDEIYVDRLINAAEQEASVSNPAAEPDQGNAADMPEVLLEKRPVVDETGPYIEMGIWSDDQGL